MSGSVPEKSVVNEFSGFLFMPFLVLISFLSLLSCSRNMPLQTVVNVDLDKYAGKWYEIAAFPQRFQKGCHCTTAEYKPTDKGYISVLNKCNKDSVNGRLDSAIGKAFVDAGSGNAKLKVQFFWPFKGKYWIIDLASNYSHAVVGHPNREYLWILNRTPSMNVALYHSILKKLSGQGFDTTRLIKTIQFDEK